VSSAILKQLECFLIEQLGNGNEFRSYFSLPPSVLPYRRLSSITSTKLEFQKLICLALSPQGDGIFENDSKLIGYLADAHFAKGTMKAVFEVGDSTLRQRLIVT
jgi:hypothetical protein